MTTAKAKIIIEGQPEAVFPDGTEITFEIKGPGIRRFLDAFSVQMARAGLTPIQWRTINQLEMQASE
ncbi:MAG: hypothetical protein V3V32_04555 [Dehalococcoidia bacterium]